MELTAKKEKHELFIDDNSIEWEVVAPGMKRKIMSYDERLMVVKVSFESGAIGTLHHHYHTQITHVEAGVFEVEIDGVKQILKQGDAFYIPPNAVHGAICIEPGTLIDVFSPMREDFLVSKTVK